MSCRAWPDTIIRQALPDEPSSFYRITHLNYTPPLGLESAFSIGTGIGHPSSIRRKSYRSCGCVILKHVGSIFDFCVHTLRSTACAQFAGGTCRNKDLVAETHCGCSAGTLPLAFGMKYNCDSGSRLDNPRRNPPDYGRRCLSDGCPYAAEVSRKHCCNGCRKENGRHTTNCACELPRKRRDSPAKTRPDSLPRTCPQSELAEQSREALAKKANQLKERLLASRLCSKLAPTGAEKLKAKPKRMAVKKKPKTEVRLLESRR